MSGSRSAARQRINAALQGGAAVLIAVPVILSMWAPAWFVGTWSVTYACCLGLFLLSRWKRGDDGRVELAWYLMLAVLFATVPLSTMAFDHGSDAVWASGGLAAFHLANEIATRNFLTIGDWRSGPAIVLAACAFVSYFELGWLVSAGIVIGGSMIIQNAHGARTEANEIRFERDHDDLTGLLNRRGLLDHLASMDNGELTIVMVDANRFKTVNDTYGYAAGDAFLTAVAAALQDRLGPQWRIARQGGDEFAAAVAGRVDVPRTLARPVVCAVPYRDTTIDIELALSAGVAHSPNADPERLMNRAGYALRAAKRNGGGMSTFDTALERRYTQALEVTQADSGHNLFAVAQPIIGSRGLLGWELLARWRAPDGEVLAPANVLPLLAENGLMPQLNDRMLEIGVEFAARFNDQPDAPSVSVNITASHLANPMLGRHVASLLQTHRVQPQRLMIEITESEGLGALASWQTTARDLVGLGVKLAIDDFGTGYSSIERMHQLPITHLKFDRAFATAVSGPLGEVVRGVVRFAGATGLGIIAEGIETADEWKAMHDAGVDMFQGHLFGEPTSLEQAVCESASSAFVSAWLDDAADQPVRTLDPPVISG